MQIMNRGGIWYQRRRVPVRYSRVDARREVWLSLHTDSETLARQKAAIWWQEQLNAWEAKLRGEDGDADGTLEVREIEVTGSRVGDAPMLAEVERYTATALREGMTDSAFAKLLSCPNGEQTVVKLLHRFAKNSANTMKNKRKYCQ